MPVAGMTTINGLGLTIIVLLGLMILLLPRIYVFVPILIAVCYVTLGQVVNIADLHFTILRILILIGWIRLIVRQELVPIKLQAIDKSLILFVLSTTVVYLIQWQSFQAVINRLGFAYNAIGSFYLFRFIIRDLNDLRRVFRVLAIIIVPLAISMLVERATHRNIFSVLGGVPEITQIREQALRCQGPFAHPILAGTFGATILPLFVSLWFQDRKARMIGIYGTAAASIIAMTASSSGAIMASLSGILAMAMWRFHQHTRVFRWGALVTVISLHMVMKAPVWYLFARLGDVMGGTGWHRSFLIDQFIKYFDEWWLFGTKYTGHWMPQVLESYPDQADITNHFIRIGVDGGLLSLILFIILIVRCFRAIGVTINVLDDEQFGMRITVWSMGAALLAHIVSFLSVSYFDQLIVVWYLLLALIALVRENIMPQLKPA